MDLLVRLAASPDWLWSHSERIFSPLFKRLLVARKEILLERLLLRLGPYYEVKSGLFRGMAYPSPKSYYSALFPKLLGTYESELSEVISSWKQLSFPVIIDVGCAEGYYAIGLARLFPKAIVYAFDSEPDARAMCWEMARINNVTGRICMKEHCSPWELMQINVEKGGLLICDCEGYEDKLFTHEVAGHLSHCHLIIEVHDHPHEENRRMKRLIENLGLSHNTRIINSVDDTMKSQYYKSKEVSDNDMIEREAAFAEWRPWIMHWLIAEPKARE